LSCKILIIEAGRVGSRKNIGQRKETAPITNLLERQDVIVDHIFFTPEKVTNLLMQYDGRVDAIINRISKEDMEPLDESYLNFLTKMENSGSMLLSDPDTINKMGSDNLTEILAGIDIIAQDKDIYRQGRNNPKDIVRLLMVGDSPTYIIKKKQGFNHDVSSPGGFSGDNSRFESIDQWSNLIRKFEKDFPLMLNSLNQQEWPALWTADFILGKNSAGQDKYYLNAMDCACVDFSENLNLGIQEKFVEEVMDRLNERDITKPKNPNRSKTKTGEHKVSAVFLL
jgi:hypothetical protein